MAVWLATWVSTGAQGPSLLPVPQANTPFPLGGTIPVLWSRSRCVWLRVCLLLAGDSVWYRQAWRCARGSGPNGDCVFLVCSSINWGKSLFQPWSSSFKYDESRFLGGSRGCVTAGLEISRGETEGIRWVLDCKSQPSESWAR